ncbi:ATP-binding protein [Amycolatopsis tolypomycina]|uniref:ATP-binding protein n=1 Tax=Amycolatopsis tolypomycina TaxID=208445 RepID=UPI0033A97605
MPARNGRDHRGPWSLPLTDLPVSALYSVRAWARSCLDGLGTTHLDDALMVVTELVTNACEHAGGPVYLRLRRSDHPCLVSLEVGDVDATTAQPAAGHSQPSDLRGRGLVMVDALSSDWGVRYPPSSTGKTVWADVPCEGRDRIPC